MSQIIKAIVQTSSSDDNYARVKLQADGIWDLSPLVMSIGQIPLVKGESVFVDVSDGFENPIILGRCSDSTTKKFKSTNGSILFQSGSDASWVVGFVKNNKLEVHTSSNVSLVIDGSKVTVDAMEVEFNGGNNGGLINIQSLVKMFNQHTHSFEGVVELAACEGITNPPSFQISRSLIEDTKVKH